jgi:integrase
MTMVLNYACRHRWVDYNPAEHVERLRDTRVLGDQPLDANILGPDEVRRLIEAARDRYKVIIQIAIFTGMRQGEILGLQWGDVDWNGRQIHVRRAWKEGAFTEPKTRNSIRRVDFPEFLVLELKKWRLQCPKGDLDLVFPSENGNPAMRISCSEGSIRHCAEQGFEGFAFTTCEQQHPLRFLRCHAGVADASRERGHGVHRESGRDRWIWVPMS